MTEVAEDADDRQFQLLDSRLIQGGALLVELGADHLPGQLRQVVTLGGVDRQQLRVLEARGDLLIET